MLKYEIQLQITRVYYRKYEKVNPGDSLRQARGNSSHGLCDGYNFTVIEEFNNKEEAVDALKKYNGYKVYDDLRKKYGDGETNYYYIADYFLEVNEYDKEGIWIKPIEIIDYAPLVEISSSEFYSMDIYNEWEKRTQREFERRNGMSKRRYDSTPDYKDF